MFVSKFGLCLLISVSIYKYRFPVWKPQQQIIRILCADLVIFMRFLTHSQQVRRKASEAFKKWFSVGSFLHPFPPVAWRKLITWSLIWLLLPRHKTGLFTRPPTLWFYLVFLSMIMVFQNWKVLKGCGQLLLLREIARPMLQLLFHPE